MALKNSKQRAAPGKMVSARKVYSVLESLAEIMEFIPTHAARK